MQATHSKGGIYQHSRIYVGILFTLTDAFISHLAKDRIYVGIFTLTSHRVNSGMNICRYVYCDRCIYKSLCQVWNICGYIIYSDMHL